MHMKSQIDDDKDLVFIYTNNTGLLYLAITVKVVQIMEYFNFYKRFRKTTSQKILWTLLSLLSVCRV